MSNTDELDFNLTDLDEFKSYMSNYIILSENKWNFFSKFVIEADKIKAYLTSKRQIWMNLMLQAQIKT